MGWLRPRQMATLLLGAAKVVIGLCHPLAFQEPRAAPILLHIVFSECPGMGKTTVARLVARLYKARCLQLFQAMRVMRDND
jgi:Holliday junction resolvasome RuvABC ATP-dependent DNA helicase subunit